jgi:predicted flap endonuclease-1-like 5' DNA nuclease
MNKYEKIWKKAKKYKKAYRKSSAKVEELQELFEDLREELKLIKKAYEKARDKKDVLKVKYKAVKKELKHRKKAETAPKESTTAPRAPQPVTPDNLKVIVGIGPRIEEVLHAVQISTIEQLADLKETELKILLEESGLKGNRYKPANWIEQASQLLTRATEQDNKE